MMKKDDNKFTTRLAFIIFTIAMILIAKYEIAHLDSTWFGAIKDDPITFIAIIVLMIVFFVLFLKIKDIDPNEEDYYGLWKKCDRDRKKKDMSDDGQV